MIPLELLTLSESEPVSKQIYIALRKLIINCTFVPGQRLVDKDIADKFGVSKQPVREALSKLAESGLLKILPQRGTFVMKISQQEVENGQFIREAVEIAVVRRAAAIIDDEYINRIYKNLDGQMMASGRGDTPYFLTLDEEFHSLLAMSIGCASAWNAIENIKANMDRVRYLSLEEISPLEMLIEQHAKIADGIKSKDPVQAELAVKKHLHEIFLSLTPITEKNPEWFDK